MFWKGVREATEVTVAPVGVTVYPDCQEGRTEWPRWHPVTRTGGGSVHPGTQPQVSIPFQPAAKY